MTNDAHSVPPKSTPFPPGTVLAAKYRVERLLGEGGMGWVVVATHLQLEQRVALKFMRASQARDTSDAIPRFLREARAAARIQSEHVARVMDVGTLENGAPYLVMEYLEGQDLESLLRSQGALPQEVVIEYMLQACEGLGEAHAAGIVHRDLKPANLFLARRSDGSVRVKLLDFGISKLANPHGVPEAAMTNTQALMGSPLYMAPEQMRSSKNVDGRADIWSMGVILYEMLGGRAPFDGETLPIVCARIMTEPPSPLRSVRPEVPEELEALVHKCLDKEPQQRFQDVASLAQALAAFAKPEGRAAAERIARVARASAVGAADNAAPSGASPGRQSSRPSYATVTAAPGSYGQAASGVAHTRATFTHTGSATPRRKSPAALPLAVGAAGLLVGLGIVFAVMTSRGQSKAGAVATGSSRVPTASSDVPKTATANPTSTTSANATETATPAPAPTSPPPPEISAPNPSPKPPQPSAGTQAHPAARPKAAPSTPKPATTAGFGGRD